MDPKTRELIAIGASVSAHCQPCLAYHLNKARELGIGENEMKQAIDMGLMVEKGAGNAMRQFIMTQEKPAQAEQPCCPSGASDCCG